MLYAMRPCCLRFLRPKSFWDAYDLFKTSRVAAIAPSTGWYKPFVIIGFAFLVFEMPILGFLGFPPFAVECYVMMNTVSLFRKPRIFKDLNFRYYLPKTIRVLLAGLRFLIFSLFASQMIDLYSIASWRP